MSPRPAVPCLLRKPFSRTSTISDCPPVYVRIDALASISERAALGMDKLSCSLNCPSKSPSDSSWSALQGHEKLWLQGFHLDSVHNHSWWNGKSSDPCGRFAVYFQFRFPIRKFLRSFIRLLVCCRFRSLPALLWTWSWGTDVRASKRSTLAEEVHRIWDLYDPKHRLAVETHVGPVGDHNAILNSEYMASQCPELGEPQICGNEELQTRFYVTFRKHANDAGEFRTGSVELLRKLQLKEPSGA